MAVNLIHRTFAAAGPCLWYSLPVQLRNPDITYGLFRWQLKGHLFCQAWTQRSVTSDMWHIRKTLTYLLTNDLTETICREVVQQTSPSLSSSSSSSSSLSSSVTDNTANTACFTNYLISDSFSQTSQIKLYTHCCQFCCIVRLLSLLL